MGIEKRLTKLEVILATLLFFIPLILIVTTKEIRPSISDYAYSKLNYLFAALLSVAGTMFIFNGSAYNSRWYNIILGCSLIGVALTPHLDVPILHYLFASIFFLGSVFCMIFFSSKEQRFIKLVIATIITIGLSGHFVFDYYSLFWAEWIGILPICIHYIGESLGKLD
jgi:hypothetical protein